MHSQTQSEEELLRRITVDPTIFGGKPIVRGRRLAVEHVRGMLAAGDTVETIRQGYPWRVVGHERVELALGQD